MERNSFLNNLDADENFLNYSHTDNNYTSNCKYFSVEQLHEFNDKNKKKSNDIEY